MGSHTEWTDLAAVCLHLPQRGLSFSLIMVPPYAMPSVQHTVWQARRQEYSSNSSKKKPAFRARRLNQGCFRFGSAIRPRVVVALRLFSAGASNTWQKPRTQRARTLLQEEDPSYWSAPPYTASVPARIAHYNLGSSTAARTLKKTLRVGGVKWDRARGIPACMSLPHSLRDASLFSPARTTAHVRVVHR